MIRRKLLFLMPLVLMTHELSSQIIWQTSIENAKKMALTSNKLILVDFWASWCGPCRRMDSETWSDGIIKMKTNSFIPVKINIDYQGQIAERFNVRSIPHIFIIDGNEKIILSRNSYLTKSQTLEILQTYALNTKSMAKELIAYYNGKSLATTIQLADKYFELGLESDKPIRNKLVSAGRSYLKEADELLKGVSKENASGHQSELDLLRIRSTLILHKPRKAIKLLNKFLVEYGNSKNEDQINYFKLIALTMQNEEDITNELGVSYSSSEIEQAKKYLNGN